MKLLLALLPLLAFANPQGLQRIAGDAHVVPTAEPRHLTIHSTQDAILHWDSFSIDAHEHTHFDTSHATLNRVIGNDPSALHGKLTSNGALFLINPNGIVIGPDGRIDTAGFLASTLDILDQDFLAGGELLFSGTSENALIHLGTIHCPTGDVTLLARTIENRGTIETPTGHTALACGTQILLKPEGSQRIFIQAAESSELEHSGAIRALTTELKSSNPYEKAIQCSGIIEATTFEERGGEIYLVADKGICELTDATLTGKTVHILGEKVGVLDKTMIDVSGTNGGGTILIGGDYQGKNPDVMNAQITFVGKETLLKADALENGAGGKVVVWSDEATKHYGKISVRGGEKSGDGGLAEVSGKSLDYQGRTDARAPFGKYGKLLLDPTNITISTGLDSGGTLNACPDGSYSPSGNDNVINTTTLQDTLANCSVTIDTTSGAAQSGIITVSDAVTWSAATTLTMVANQNIAINAGISNTNSDMTPFTAMDFTANGVPSGAYTGINVNNVVVATDRGNIVMNGTGGSSGGVGVQLSLSSAQITSVNGNIDLTGTGKIVSGISSVSGGRIETTGTGNITLQGTAGTGGSGITIPVLIQSVSGMIDLTGVVNAGGGTGILLGQTNGIRSTSGDITIDGTSNSTNANSHGVSITNSWSTGSSGHLQITGSGGTDPTSFDINLSNNITSAGAITFHSPVRIDIISRTVTGTGSGTITFADTVDAEVAGDEGLTVAGGSGQIVFQQPLGSIVRLGPVSLTTTTTSVTTIGNAVNASSFAMSTNAGITISAAVDCDGAGGIDLANSGLAAASYHGINVNAALTTAGGPISLSGVGGNATGNTGIRVTNSGSVISNGGTITFHDCVGGTTGSNCYGVHLLSASSLVDAGIGDVVFDNIEGKGTTIENDGVRIGFINAATVRGATITATNISGGLGTNLNAGFHIQGGILGDANTTSIAITANGGVSGTTSLNHGIYLNGSTLQTASNGSITLNGTGGGDASLGGSGNHGINFSSSVAISTNSLTLTGVGGNGSGGTHRGVNVTSAPTLLTLTGTSPEVEFLNCRGGGDVNNNGGSNNQGVYFSNSFDAGSAALNFTTVTGGSGGTSGATNHYGVYCDSGTISGGTIEMIGLVGGEGAMGATAVTTNHGFLIDSGATLGSASTTSISITATGGSGTGVTSTNDGIRIAGGTLQTETTSGTITLTGQGGGNGGLAGNGNQGINWNASTSVATRTLTFTGTGGSGTGGSHRGVVISSSLSLSGGDITFANCMGGTTGSFCAGVYIAGTTTVVEAVRVGGIGGAVVFDTVEGKGTASSNQGVRIGESNTPALTLRGHTITATNVRGATTATSNNNDGFSMNAGILGGPDTVSIDITAEGVAPTSLNNGINLLNGAVIQTASSGSVTLTGTGGGDSAASSVRNHGIECNSIGGATITTHSLTLTGQGGEGLLGNHRGVNVDDLTLNLTSDMGMGPSLTFLDCVGGSGGGSNSGVQVNTTLAAGTDTTLSFTNIRGGSGASSHGIHISAGTTSVTAAGTITMAGTVSNTSTGSSKNGIVISGLAALSSAGGAIDLTGTVEAGAEGSSNNGILLSATNPISTTGNPSITLNGTNHATGSTCRGVSMTSSAWVTGSTADLDITGVSDGGGANSFPINLGGAMTHSGNVDFNNAVGLSSTSTVTGDGDATKTITFASTIDGTTAGVQDLTVNAGSGQILLQGALGGTTRLGAISLTTTEMMTGVTLGGNVTANSFATAGAPNITKLTLSLAGTTTIDTSAADGAISFGGTVEGTTSGAQNFMLDAGAGTITVDGEIGGGTGLGVFDATAGSFLLNEDITATSGSIDAPITPTGARRLKKTP